MPPITAWVKSHGFPVSTTTHHCIRHNLWRVGRRHKVITTVQTLNHALPRVVQVQRRSTAKQTAARLSHRFHRASVETPSSTFLPRPRYGIRKTPCARSQPPDLRLLLPKRPCWVFPPCIWSFAMSARRDDTARSCCGVCIWQMHSRLAV